MFRAHGERYIQAYKPHQRAIAFIRSVRLCRTPGLGRIVYTCKGCGEQVTIYKSCGNSQCPVCQSIKREQWADALQGKLLRIPYVHLVFTMPHQLNGLARSNKSAVYSILMRAAWKTVQAQMKDKTVLPGMTAVLHPFGSDMKYHVHVHALVTFGGLEPSGKWVYPTHRYWIASFRKMCGTFKAISLQLIRKDIAQKKITSQQGNEDLLHEVGKIRWVVHSTRATTQTDVLKSYLARYINRIAISNNRLKYLAQTDEVAILYNDYRNQQNECAAPKAIKHLDPLTAIHQIIQHVLPRHFQKSRHYGLHHTCTLIRNQAEEAIKAHPATVRTALQIITALLKRELYQCDYCQGQSFIKTEYPPDRIYLGQYLAPGTERAPPTSWRRPVHQRADRSTTAYPSFA